MTARSSSASGLVVLGCLEETRDTILHLYRLGVAPERVVGLAETSARAAESTNYVRLETVAARLGAEYHEVGDYSLRSRSDAAAVVAGEPTVLAVIGWQRLVPADVLEQVPVAVGFHGSSRILPWGRGRSPINWSIIEGRDRFALHMFALTPGVDDGDVLGVRLYDISPYDDVRTVYYKTALAQAELLAAHLPDLESGAARGMPQVGEPYFYGRRRPGDGRVNWSHDAASIARLVRAVTAPYPGASTTLRGSSMQIWHAQPFSRDFFDNAAVGEVCFVSESGTSEFVVRCGDGTVLVRSWTCMQSPVAGDVLT